MQSLRPSLGVLFVALLGITACSEPIRDWWPAVVGVKWVDSSGMERVDRAPTLDFGPVTAGERPTRSLFIRSLGRVPLKLTGLTVTVGDASQVALGAEAGAAVFHVPLPLPLELQGGTEQEVAIIFAPPEPTDAYVKDYSVQLTLKAEGTMKEEDTVVITLKGQAVSTHCLASSPSPLLEMGVTARGDTSIRELVLRNSFPTPVTARISDLESPTGDALAFRFMEDSAKGEVTIPSGGETRVRIGFSPTEPKTYLATVKMRAAEGCPEVPITLAGKGVEQILTWRVDNAQFCKTRDAAGVCQDPFIDCGFVTPDTVAIHRTLTFLNVGNREVEVKNLRFSRWPTDFFVEGDVGVGVENPLVVPARSEGAPGEASITVACQRSELGRITSFLTGETSLQSQSPFGQVQAIVTGGGPDISVRPSSTLDFGPVAYFVDATTPVYAERRLVVSNVGTLSEDPLYNLHIRSVTLTEEPGTEPGTFSVLLAPGSTLPTDGMVASNQGVYLVRVTPHSFGQKAARLTFASNDPDSPNVTVDLRADVRDLPPCSYVLTPEGEGNFGTVARGGSGEVTFTFTNTAPNGSDLCLVSNLQVSANSAPAFSLPEYAGEEGAAVVHEVAGGQSLAVKARVHVPEDAVPGTELYGTAEFYVSSLDQFYAEVPLFVTVGE